MTKGNGEDRGILPNDGERELLVGSTGSGKTGLALWVLRRFPVAPIVIMDTKDEDKFLRLPKVSVVGDWDSLQESLNRKEYDYVVFRPSDMELSDPMALDAYLYAHYQENVGIPIYIDEIYSFHRNARPGPGLVALLTRGRSKGITTIMATQRPAHLSRFAITEAQKFLVLSLIHEDDRKTMGLVIPGFAKLPAPPKHGFYFYRTGESAPVLMPPVKLDDGIDTGYSMADTKSTKGAAHVEPQDRYEWL